MSRTRPSPALRPDVTLRAAQGYAIGPESRQRLGLLLVVFCTCISFATQAVIKDTQCDPVSSGECGTNFGSDVVCGTSGFCECVSADHMPVGDQCRHKCVTEARQLHNKERRIKNYKNGIGEPVVTDYQITEGWYSVDQYRLMGAGTGNLTGGSCGTRYQIVLKEDSTVNWDNLDLNEVALTATVYGRPKEHGEDLEIRVRKCENAFQYYLKPPSIRLAAYCFDCMEGNSLSDEEDPLTFPSNTYLNIETSLHFREELKEGQWFDVPFVIWTCRMIDIYNEMRDSISEMQFYSVTWFADNTRIQSTEPLPILNDTNVYYNGRMVWTAANLTEDELLDAGFSLGVMIRCGVQVSRSDTGKLSSMRTSSFDTNIYALACTTCVASDKGDSIMLLVRTAVPLGCLAPVGIEEGTCVLKLRVIRDDCTLVCSDDPGEADVHELCGVTLFGRTKNGEYPSQHYINENGTTVHEVEGVYIQLDSTSERVKRSAAVYYSLAVIDNTAGHVLWDNYYIHNVKIDLPATSSEDEMFYRFNVHHGTINNLSRPTIDIKDLHSYGHIGFAFVEEAGKYIMLWSGKFPFMVEVEIESTVEGDLYVCGFYLRYGSDIYAYSFCGDVFIEGLIFGDGSYLSEKTPDMVYRQISLSEVGLYIYPYIYGGQLLLNFYSGNGCELGFLEGICCFGHSRIVGRHGNVYSNVSTEFLRSWR